MSRSSADTEKDKDVAGVEARHLFRSFSTRRGESVQVLKDLDFSARPGEVTCVTGPSGCGKSTLLYCLSGLEAPDSGKVTVLGRDIGKMGATRSALFRRRYCGFMFQSYNLVTAMTARDNVSLPFVLRHMVPPRRRIRELFERFGLSGQMDIDAEKLSGGEQQRVALIRLIAAEPRVLFADEPTGALDQKMSDEVSCLLRQAHEDGRTVILVTHNPDIAAVCDVRYHLLDGRVESVTRLHAGQGEKTGKAEATGKTDTAAGREGDRR